MNPDDREQLLEDQSNELYAGIGEFIVSFELVIDALRSALIQLWSGRSGMNQFLFQPALAELTADPITKVFQASVAVAIRHTELSAGEKDIGEKIVLSLCKQIRALTESRNEIAHGTWFIGWASADATDFSVANGLKPKNTKTGTLYRSIDRKKEDFDALIDQCRLLRDIIQRFGLMLVMGERLGTFEKNFTWDEDRVSLTRSLWTFKPRCTSSNADSGTN